MATKKKIITQPAETALKQKYIYQAKVLGVHDGDTVTVLLDCGFGIKFEEKIRLYGINTPELKVRSLETNKMVVNPEGTKALNETKRLLDGKDVIVQTIKDEKEKFGRYLGIIQVDVDGVVVDVNEHLLKNGFAKELLF